MKYLVVVLPPHSSRVLILTSIYCQCGVCVLNLTECPSTWIVDVCVFLGTNSSLIQVLLPLVYFQNRLWIHCNTDQDKMKNEFNERIN